MCMIVLSWVMMSQAHTRASAEPKHSNSICSLVNHMPARVGVLRADGDRSAMWFGTVTVGVVDS